jgi:hypothetical protein
VFFRKANRTMIGVVMLASAALCLLLAAGWTIYSYHLTRTALRATGHITQMVERHGDHGDYWYPVYTFADRNGVPHTIHSGVGSAPPAYAVGDAVTVLYYAGNGIDAHLNEWSTLWGVPLVLLAVAVINLPIGIGVLLWPRIAGHLRPAPGG